MVPRCCPFAGPDETCRIAGHHFRARKTGPGFPVLVAYCGVHLRAFTVYPPGHVPYGRQAVAPADSRGQVLRQGGGEAAPGRPLWEKTIFVAAVEASAGQQWSDSSLGQDQWRRRTQGRWLELGARLLGLTEVTERVQERLSEQLGLDCLEIREQARAYRTAKGPQSRGQVIEGILAGLPLRSCLVDDLLAGGCIAGLWGRPSRWDPGGPAGGVLRPLF